MSEEVIEVIATPEPKWTTFYGQKMELKDISHQHLSNILHFFKIFWGSDPHPMIREELNARFGGLQLPYHPQISFTREIRALKELGYTTGEPNADIVINGKWIGTVKYN